MNYDLSLGRQHAAAKSRQPPVVTDNTLVLSGFGFRLGVGRGSLFAALSRIPIASFTSSGGQASVVLSGWCCHDRAALETSGLYHTSCHTIPISTRSRKDMGPLGNPATEVISRGGPGHSGKTPAWESTGPGLTGCDEAGSGGRFSRFSEASPVERNSWAGCRRHKTKTLGGVGSRFHADGGGVGPLHKQSRLRWCQHGFREDDSFSEKRIPCGGRKRKGQRMQRASHGSELHRIGDDGDGAVYGAVEFLFRGALGSEKERFVFRSMDM